MASQLQWLIEMSWLETHLLVVIVGFLVAASAVVILQQGRSPQATLAWLMFLVLIPYLAVPLFIVMGFRKRLRLRRKISNPTSSPDSLGPEAPQIERMLCRYGLGRASHGNRLDVLADGEGAWTALLDLVESAQVSLDVTLYLLGNDPVGLAFCAALEERARKGVAIRLILDSIGSLKRPRAALRSLRAAGAEVKLYSPLLHGPRSGRLNQRNHRKMLIADGARVWSGGRNVAEDYLGPTPNAGRWQDLSYRIAGPAAAAYASIFRSDWRAAGGTMPKLAVSVPGEQGDSVLQLVPAGADVPEDPLHDALVFACHSARARLWIVTPYFLPTPALSEALAIAARRGVDVRLLIPERSNQRLADLARGAWLRELDRNSCHIYLHPEMVHAKAVLTDNLAFVGSANFDARSLLLNFEVMALLYSATDVAAVHGWIAALLAQAPEGIPPASFARRSVEGLFKLGSPIL